MEKTIDISSVYLLWRGLKTIKFDFLKLMDSLFARHHWVNLSISEFKISGKNHILRCLIALFLILKWYMFAFTKLSNIIRIRFTAKISFKMPKQGRHTDKGSPPIIVYLSQQFFQLLFSFFSLYHTVHGKHLRNFISYSSICLVFLNLLEFIIKSSCLLLAVPRDSPNCKKHNEENNSHEREHDLRRDLEF